MAYIVSLQIDFSLLGYNFLVTRLWFFCVPNLEEKNIYLGGLWSKFFFKLTFHGLRNKCKRVCSLGNFVFSVCRFPINYVSDAYICKLWFTWQYVTNYSRFVPCPFRIQKYHFVPWFCYFVPSLTVPEMRARLARKKNLGQ